MRTTLNLDDDVAEQLSGLARAQGRSISRVANHVPDAHLAALAIEWGLELVSADGDFARYRGLRWRNPFEA